jgi:hypothetical protein
MIQPRSHIGDHRLSAPAAAELDFRRLDPIPDAMRRQQFEEAKIAEAAAADAERVRQADLLEKRKDPAFLEAELRQIEADLALAEHGASAVIPTGGSWTAKDSARRVRDMASHEAQELRDRRDRVREELRVRQEWIAHAPHRKAAAPELPDAERILEKMTSELELVEGEYLVALDRVRTLQETAER